MLAKIALAWAAALMFIDTCAAHPHRQPYDNPPFGRRQYGNISKSGLQEHFTFTIEARNASSSPVKFENGFFIGSQFGDSAGSPNYDDVIAYVSQGDFVSIAGGAPSVNTTDLSGVWENFGAYEASDENWSSIRVEINDEAAKSYGTLELKHSTAPPSWACGPGKGTNLASLIDGSSSAAEIKTLEGTNWAHLAGGVGAINQNANGSSFSFSGPFVSRHFWGLPYPEAYSRFYLSSAKAGPYVLDFWSVAPLGEPDNWATIGYLAAEGKVLYSHCNKASKGRSRATTTITPHGAVNVTNIPFALPESLTVDFTDSEHKQYRFDIELPKSWANGGFLGIGTYALQNGIVRGGEVGGKQYEDLAVVESWVVAGDTLL